LVGLQVQEVYQMQFLHNQEIGLALSLTVFWWEPSTFLILAKEQCRTWVVYGITIVIPLFLKFSSASLYCPRSCSYNPILFSLMYWIVGCRSFQRCSTQWELVMLVLKILVALGTHQQLQWWVICLISH